MEEHGAEGIAAAAKHYAFARGVIRHRVLDSRLRADVLLLSPKKLRHNLCQLGKSYSMLLSRI